VTTGTGFSFSSLAYFIALHHFVYVAKIIKVLLLNIEKINASEAIKDTNNDIAILTLSQFAI
jgi:S1-C subfamily serine protease